MQIKFTFARTTLNSLPTGKIYIMISYNAYELFT